MLDHGETGILFLFSACLVYFRKASYCWPCPSSHTLNI